MDTSQLKKIDSCENLYSVNHSHLLINHKSGYIEEKNQNKYFIFDDSVNENKALLKKYAYVWDGIKTKKKMVVNKVITEKVTRKLNVILTTTGH